MTKESILHAAISMARSNRWSNKTMAYERLQWGLVSQRLSPVLAAMSGQFCDIRELIIARESDGALSVAKLLALMTDGAANLLEPTNKEQSARFKKFVLDNFPWADDPPFGLIAKDVVDQLWEVARVPVVHRLGLQPADAPFNVRYVGLHTGTDERMSELELSSERPFSEPTFKFDGHALTIQVESWYWALRRAVINAVNTKEKVDAIVAHMQAGEFARMNSVYKLLNADVPRPKK